MQDGEAAKWAAKWERAAAALAEATTRLTASETKRLQACERSQQSTIALMRSLEKQRELEASLSESREENVVLKADVEALCHGSVEPPSRVRAHVPSEMTMDELQDMVVGLEERLAKQSALASHWKGEAFRWAQQAESEAIADASASIAWASSATKECSRNAADKEGVAGAVSPPPVPVAWLQSELRSTMAALEASREREATLVSQLADFRSGQLPSSTNDGSTGTHTRTALARQNSPMDSRDGRATVAALSKLERTLGVEPSSSLAFSNEPGAGATTADLDGWKCLTARLIRLTSVLGGKPRAGIQYTPRKSAPAPAAAPAPTPAPAPAPAPGVSATCAAVESRTIQRDPSPEMRILKYQLLQKGSQNLDQTDIDVRLELPTCAAHFVPSSYVFISRDSLGGLRATGDVIARH